MTLPIQPLCGGATSHPADGKAGGAAVASRRSYRARACLSAAWADHPTNHNSSRREQRRAICYSWSVGYGTLTEEETPLEHHDPKNEKVADHISLFESSRGISVATSTAHAHSPHPRPNSSEALQPPPPATLAPPHHRTPSTSFFSMPGLKTLVSRRRNSGVSTTTTSPSADSADVAPLVKRNGGHAMAVIRPAASLASLRKFETVLAAAAHIKASASSSSVSGIAPLRPTNRLRDSGGGGDSRLCSRCSSILTLASSSRYSLSSSTGGFVAVTRRENEDEVDGEEEEETRWEKCKLCMEDVPHADMFRIDDCKCEFCAECMRQYVKCEIGEGAYDISCPDAQCPSRGMLHQEEIERLAGAELYAKHKRYRLNREIELDKNRTWCPRAGCETVCNVCPTHQCNPQSVHCPSCTADFCSNCKLEWHEGVTCEANNKRLKREGKAEESGIPFNSDLIKCCPMCKVPIEKDEGCAQMMCKRCKHVFCWYCLASLDDDFLLRHYDKGPCKNKLGHSRASVIWHRTQVIGIFAGFGILLLVASPLLLLAAPCIVCCKCRVCNAGTTKLDNEDVDET